MDNKGQGRTTPVDKNSDLSQVPLEDVLESRAEEYLQICWEIPTENEKHAVATKLYAACRRLSAAVRERDAAAAVLEIASNLMACEEMAILQMKTNSKELSFIDSVGLSEKQRLSLQGSAARISAEIDRGRVYMAGENGSGDEMLRSLGIQAFVPLWQNRKTKGAIVFFNLLPQRNGFGPGDRELLDLFSVYAGPCLFNA
jgi:hypothetical protein